MSDTHGSNCTGSVLCVVVEVVVCVCVMCVKQFVLPTVPTV